MARIVFLGPPGVGKGTQAKILSARLGVPHLSTGDLLREAVRAKTSLGEEADVYMRAGKLVPDDLVLRILKDRLAREDAKRGFLLDGYPRNVAQAGELERITDVDRVLSFDLPESLLLERLTNRRSCPKCGTVYNLKTRPPKRDTVCDHDETALVQRSDDTVDAVRTRIKVYHDQTAPLLEHYRRLGRLTTLDASGTPAEVERRIQSALEGRP